MHAPGVAQRRGDRDSGCSAFSLWLCGLFWAQQQRCRRLRMRRSLRNPTQRHDRDLCPSECAAVRAQAAIRYRKTDTYANRPIATTQRGNHNTTVIRVARRLAYLNGGFCVGIHRGDACVHGLIEHIDRNRGVRFVQDVGRVVHELFQRTDERCAQIAFSVMRMYAPTIALARATGCARARSSGHLTGACVSHTRGQYFFFAVFFHICLYTPRIDLTFLSV